MKFIKSLIPTNRGIIGALFRDGRNGVTLIHAGTYESETKAHADLDAKASKPAVTVVGHWPYTAIIRENTIIDYQDGHHATRLRFDRHIEVEDGNSWMVAGISGEELEEYKADYHISLPGAMLLMARRTYDQEIFDSTQVAFVMVTENFVAALVFDRRESHVFQVEICDETSESLKGAFDRLFGPGWRQHLGRIVTIGHHPAMHLTDLEFIRGDAIIESFAAQRAFQEELAEPQLTNLLDSTGELGRSAYPALLASLALCVTAGFGPDFLRKLPHRQSQASLPFWTRMKMSGLPLQSLTSKLAAQSSIYAMALTILFGGGYVFYHWRAVSAMQVQNKTRRISEETRQKNASEIKATLTELNEKKTQYNSFVAAANSLTEGQKINPAVVTAVYGVETPDGITLTNLETSGRNVLIKGYSSVANIAASQPATPGTPQVPQAPIQKEVPVAQYVNDLKKKNTVFSSVNYKFSSSASGDQGEFIITCTCIQEVVVPKFDELRIPANGVAKSPVSEVAKN